MKSNTNKDKNNAAVLISELQNLWEERRGIVPGESSKNPEKESKSQQKHLDKKDPNDFKNSLPPASKESAISNNDIKILSKKDFLNQGLKFYNKREFKKAINCFQIVLEIDPNELKSKDYLLKAQTELDKYNSVTQSFARDIIEQIPVAKKLSGTLGTSVVTNKGVKKFLGGKNEGIIEEEIESLFPNTTMTENIIKEMKDNGYLPDKCNIEDLDQAEVSDLNSNFLLKDADGNQIGMGGIIKEITKRKKAEERLQLLSDAIEQSTEGIVVSNLEGDVFFANNAFASMHGYEPDKIVGKHLKNFHTMEQIPSLEAANGQIKETGKFSGELWHVKADGTIFPTVSYQSLLWDNTGNPIGVLSTHRDITKLKKSEEEIRKLGSAIEQSIDGIIISDLESKITYINEAFANMHGYSPKDMIGMKIEQLHNDEQMDIFQKGMEEVETKGSWMGEIGQIRKDNSIFPSYMSLTLLRDEHDNPIGSLCVTRDITIRKRMEEELKRYTEHLEEEVKLRAYELIQSEKMASLGQLVSGVAHELNNPLGYLSSNSEVIGEYLESLLVTIKDKKTQEILLNIKELMTTNFKGINRISKITKSLERFAIPTRSEKIRSDINQGLKDTLHILYNQFKSRITIKTDYGEIPKFICNIGQLNQVFTNIIQNASEAMDSGTIWIKTRCDENNVFIEIKDNGSGIPNEIINKIFDPFFTTKKGCTGLGLSVSFGIIQSYGGNIKVNSEVGSGTEIIINLPLVEKNE